MISLHTRCDGALADALSAIHRACFDASWQPQAIMALFETPGTYACVHSQGFILCRASGEQADLMTFAVLPNARKHGIGVALLADALNVARGMGAGAMFLEVSEGNAGAIKLYEKQGFSALTTRKNYYASGENALLMRKSLT